MSEYKRLTRRNATGGGEVNIPKKKLKVGGVVYTVNITNKLDLGSSYTGEILYDEHTINIRPSKNMEQTFLHELIHAILNMGGYRNHDEQLVDSIAHGLYAVIVDNKNIFSKKEFKK